MATEANAVVRRARLALGARFRPQGRAIEEGLDCVGLAAFAYGAAEADVPRDYALRGTGAGVLHAQLPVYGLVRVESGGYEPGDLGLFSAGPGQLHLAVVTGSTLIHADAGLRRVVERPMPAPWPLMSLWRLRTQLE